MLYLGVGIALMMVAIFATMFRNQFSELIPKSTELVLAAWTGVFAVTVGVWAAGVVSHEGKELRDLVKRARFETRHLNARLSNSCATWNADPGLVEAVMLVECLQRPAWVRRLERAKGRIFKRGTYGVMQVDSPIPISDSESIDLAVSTTFRDSLVLLNGMDKGSPEFQRAFDRMVQNHNSDPVFVSFVQKVYFEILYV